MQLDQMQGIHTAGIAAII